MGTLALAVELADLAADYAESGEALDPRREAKRLVREHPEAETSVAVVTKVLEEEQAATKRDIDANVSAGFYLSYPYPTD